MPTQYPSFATPAQYALITKTTEDPNIQGLLDAASSAIRRYCGWHVSPVVTEEVVADGSGGHIQSLPTLRLVSILALTETSRGGTVTVWLPDDLEWSRNGYLRHSGYWTDRLQGISASIEHGFEQADCLDLATLCVVMAARAESNPYGETQETVGSVSVTFGGSGTGSGVALYPDQMAQLDAYRLNQRV